MCMMYVCISLFGCWDTVPTHSNCTCKWESGKASHSLHPFYPISRYEQQKQAYEAGYSAAILKTDVPGGVGQPGIVMTTPRHRRRKKDPDMPRRNM